MLWVCLVLVLLDPSEASPAENMHMLEAEEHKLILNLGHKGQILVNTQTSLYSRIFMQSQ